MARKAKATPRSRRAKAPTAEREPADPDRIRLVAAIAAAPDDRELQSIYADALIALGGEHALRGELIQLWLANPSAKTAKRAGEVIGALAAARAKRG